MSSTDLPGEAGEVSPSLSNSLAKQRLQLAFRDGSVVLYFYSAPCGLRRDAAPEMFEVDSELFQRLFTGIGVAPLGTGVAALRSS